MIRYPSFFVNEAVLALTSANAFDIIHFAALMAAILRGVAQPGSARALGAWGRGFKSLHPDHFRGKATWPRGQAVKTSPFHGGNRGSIPLGVTTFSPRRLFPSRTEHWAFSSVGQSGRLIPGWSGVRVPEGPPILWPGSSVGLECQPVTLEVEGSSPFRVAIFLLMGLLV